MDINKDDFNEMTPEEQEKVLEEIRAQLLEQENEELKDFMENDSKRHGEDFEAWW